MSHSPHRPSALDRLKDLPITIFAMTMGLTGLAACWQTALNQYGMDNLLPIKLVSGLHQATSYLAPLLFITLCLLYSVKLVKFKTAFLEEITHPVKRNFQAAFTISLGLICGFILPADLMITHGLFIIAVLMHLLIMLNLIRNWILIEQNLLLITPANFIPIVGNIALAPVAMMLNYPALAWFFAATGLITWVLLFVLVFWRFVTQPPLPAPLMPSMFIMIAPPALSFLAFYSLLSPSAALPDTVPLFQFIFYTIIVCCIFPLSVLPEIMRAPFSMSWWALSFPLAAFCSALQKYSHLRDSLYLGYIAEFFLSILTLLTLWLALRSLKLVKY